MFAGRNIRACVVYRVVFSTVIWIAVRAQVTVVEAASRSTSPPVLGTPVPSFINLFLALGVVIILAVVTIRFLAKRTNVQQKGSIQVIAARQVAPNRSVQILEYDGKRWMIGVGDGISLLAELKDDDEVWTDVDVVAQSADAVNRTFGNVFAEALATVRNRYRPRTEEDKADD